MNVQSSQHHRHLQTFQPSKFTASAYAPQSTVSKWQFTEGQFGREYRGGMNPYAGLCSPSCSSTSNIFPQSTHISQQLPPPRQLTEIASVIYGTGRCHCAPFYLKLQYVGITMETAENCPNYCQRARI